MKRKKVDLQERGKNDVYHFGVCRITKEDMQYFFEVGGEVTCDVAEAVSILMRKVDWADPVWDVVIDANSEDVTPEKALFWLTGGYSEWRTLEHYSMPWATCYIHFQEKFGQLIANTISRCNTLGEMRDCFHLHLNLPVLYDFAIGAGLVR
jgi:hypothetical protein